MTHAIRLLSVIAAFWPTMALAYVGPGAGLSAIGSLIALVMAFILGVLGFVWFPLRRILRKRGKDMYAEDADDTDVDSKP